MVRRCNAKSSSPSIPSLPTKKRPNSPWGRFLQKLWLCQFVDKPSKCTKTENLPFISYEESCPRWDCFISCFDFNNFWLLVLSFTYLCTAEDSNKPSSCLIAPSCLPPTWTTPLSKFRSIFPYERGHLFDVLFSKTSPENVFKLWACWHNLRPVATDKEENSLLDWKNNVCSPVKTKSQVEETTAEPE